MTREEAIKHIITYAYYDDDIPLQVATALDMAISALRAQQEQESKPTNGWISVSRTTGYRKWANTTKAMTFWFALIIGQTTQTQQKTSL